MKQNFYGSGATPYNTIMVDPHHYTFTKLIECIPPRVNTSGNNGLWVIMMH